MPPRQKEEWKPSDDLLDVWYKNWMPEPIVCWSCGHFLGEKCHYKGGRNVPCRHGGESGTSRRNPFQCNGFASQEEPAPVRRNHTPLPNYFALVDGHVMYVEVNGEEKVFVPLNETHVA
ncbi:hypothetical protein GUITHDRAFT_117636 [Guillardia theta CCMP2712]|uniref:Uncharacterized protein n=1 Tax=Guillardia theta (strain CCMP2712) TaxID=905079 RepID=L1IIR9_GUITC|nr:hypothetical protein GUITHDRAFT_117636 [Guillardia theta CCMP2712]EKX36131.1 hypothetical protein GUITHDRAFT_117636 [Guillardia theta CCMP2712]|eukprot:XP_005823111.1 hypothetical protein GUITHDRAFT_117636 [Guillardia theta CCMP2712]